MSVLKGNQSITVSSSWWKQLLPAELHLPELPDEILEELYPAVFLYGPEGERILEFADTFYTAPFSKLSKANEQNLIRLAQLARRLYIQDGLDDETENIRQLITNILYLVEDKANTDYYMESLGSLCALVGKGVYLAGSEMESLRTTIVASSTLIFLSIQATRTRMNDA